MILWFLLSLTVNLVAAADPNHISINCGGAAPATALTGRKWGRDAAPEGSSTVATVEGELMASVDPVPYLTARVSRSNFSYTFRLKPGQKFVRLHFNPAPYRGFESSSDLFTVEFDAFTLLANFSASVTARALSRDVLVKEFCVNIEENETLKLAFYPEISQWKSNYAFVNGIDIISLPPMFEDAGVPVIGRKSVMYVDKSTALERVHYQHVKWGSPSSSDDVSGMFGMWAESSVKKNAGRGNNRTWSVDVDVGFMYLVRLHLCEVEVEMDFELFINNISSLTNVEMRQQRGKRNTLWYNNYIVMAGGVEQGDDEHDISISLQSQHDYVDRHGPLEGFEVFKLSNRDRTLASPSLLFPREKSPSQTLQTLLHSLQSLLHDLRGSTSLWGFLNMCILSIILGHHMLEDNSVKKDNKPSTWRKNNKPLALKKDDKPLAWKQRLCRCFSLAEIQAATENFNERFVLGEDGFGKIYKGFIDNGREIVAVKRIKIDHKQEEHGFWTEIEILCELRHVNLVSLIGYCREKNEKLLVYEYFPGGTLADHINKIPKEKSGSYSLSWKQRLKICIGVGRALDYLHMGCSRIIHRDLKASNIFLDENFLPKVSDFSLIKCGSGDESPSQDSKNLELLMGCNRIIHRDLKASNIFLDENFLPKVSDFSLIKCGSGDESPSQDSKNLELLTFGYVDTAYWETPELTYRSDVYSFGVLLLEVLCGRPAPPWNGKDKGSLITWKGQVDQLVDPNLRGEISPDSLKTFVKVVEVSLHDEPKKRPHIGHIVAELEHALLQQEKGESVAPNERIKVEDVLSCTDKSGEENMNFTKPNDASPNLGELITRSRARILVSDPWDILGDCADRLRDKALRKYQALRKLNSGSMLGFKEWQSEVKFRGGFSHPNLVKLSAYFLEDKEQDLYEMVAKRSLENCPFLRNLPFQPLRWDSRLNIAKGIARGLALLHNLHASNERVIHRDMKCANILLDASSHAKLYDFDLTWPVIGTHGNKCSMHDLLRSLGVRVLDRRRPPGLHSYLEGTKCERRVMIVMDDMWLMVTYPCLSAPPLPLLLVFNRLESESEPNNRPSMVDKPDMISSSSNERPTIYCGD